jgi:hypothetical protein
MRRILWLRRNLSKVLGGAALLALQFKTYLHQRLQPGEGKMPA